MSPPWQATSLHAPLSSDSYPFWHCRGAFGGGGGGGVGAACGGGGGEVSNGGGGGATGGDGGVGVGEGRGGGGGGGAGWHVWQVSGHISAPVPCITGIRDLVHPNAWTSATHSVLRSKHRT